MRMMQNSFHMFILIGLFLAVQEPSIMKDSTNTEDSWTTWCSKSKREMQELQVFNTRFHQKDLDWKDSNISFIEFDALMVPYFAKQEHEMSVNTSFYGGTVLRIKYPSGLLISIRSAKIEVVEDIFERFQMQLPDAIRRTLEAKYSSEGQGPINIFAQLESFIRLRIAGFNLTVDDINCKDRDIARTISVMAKVLAAASADVMAIRRGEDIAYQSSNKLEGVITRQGGIVSIGNESPRVTWMGEFIGEQLEYHVIISFKESDKEKYDFLGKALANPAGME